MSAEGAAPALKSPEPAPKAAVEETAKSGDPPVDAPVRIVPTDYVCFGTIDDTHPECKACKFNQQCAVEKSKK